VRVRTLLSAVGVLGVAGLALSVPATTTMAAARSAGGTGAVQQMKVRPAHPHAAGTSSNLYYHGGVGGVGVETGSDKVYVVWWGSQWNNNDPSGQAAIQQGFFNGVGGSGWNNSVTQYCEGVATGSTSCSGGTAATNPKGVLAGVWYDNSASAPRHPSQSQLAGEAVRAAAHFGNTGAGSNNAVQYVVSTAHGFSSRGFGTQYCAWHSSTSSSYGNIAYTNMPYITDAGASCGANFVNSGSAGLTDGITIVGGHEFGETETDIFPNGGWLDSSGAENGDKCAWISSGQGASANITLPTGTFAVQSLWSNASSGCVLSY
jgi:hypothetical protein